MLIGKDGWYDTWVAEHDGEVRMKMLGNTYLCEGGIQESTYGEEIYETHVFYAPMSDKVVDDLTDDEVGDQRVPLDYIHRVRNQWTIFDDSYNEKEITADAAATILSKYKRISLNWKPRMDYPLAEGCTLRDYLNEKDVRLSASELQVIYRDYLKER